MNYQLQQPRVCRREVIACLRMFAGEGEESSAALAELSAEVEKIPALLCQLWIDQVYLPALSYCDGVKGDYDLAAIERFNAEFSSAELEALARFHRFLELRLEMLGRRDCATGALVVNAAGGDTTKNSQDLPAHFYQLHQNEAWVNICRDARNTLALLDL